MGEVYRARDARLGRDVAIKVLPAALSNEQERLKRFEQEARSVAALNHPNILTIYEIETHDGAPYLVSELLEGETLQQRLREGPLTLRKALDVAIQTAHGIAAAHEKGIVHRDLKPANLFITNDGRVKILDFGLAKLTQPDAPADSSAGDGTVTRTTGDSLRSRRAGHRRGRRARHRRLHVPGASARQGGRRPLRHFCARHDSVRNAVRQARLPA